MKPIHIRLVALVGVITIEIVNMFTTRYDGTMLNVVLCGLLALAGYDILKKRRERQPNDGVSMGG